MKKLEGDYPHVNLYGESQFGGLRVLTILKDHPDKYGLPLQPKAIDVKTGGGHKGRLPPVRDVYLRSSLAEEGRLQDIPVVDGMTANFI